MADNALVSLKAGGRWRGRDARSPTGAGLAQLVNGYVSSDGQEIRRMPGYKCVLNNEASPAWETLFPISVRTPSGGGWTPHYSFVRKRRLHCFAQVRDRLLVVGEADFPKQPVHGVGGSAKVLITGWDSGGNWISLAANPKPYTDPYGIGLSTNSVTFGPPVGDFFWVEGTGNPELDNAFHNVAQVQIDTPAPGVARIVLGSWTTLTTTGASAGGAYLYRTSIGGLVSGNQVSLKEPDSLVVWTSISLPSMVSPIVAQNVSQVAGRNPDYGGEIEFAAGWTHGAAGVPRRKATVIPRRLNPEVSGDRLLLAAPGVACVFQVPVMIPTAGGWIETPDLPNSIHDQPRCLGVPKAVMFDPGDKTALKVANAGTLVGPTNGTYRVRVAYRDDGTGEVGLPSEEVEYSITNQRIRLFVMHPGYLMGDCAAATVIIYMTGPGGSVTAHYRAVGKDSQNFWGALGTNAAKVQFGLKPSPATPFGPTYYGHLWMLLDIEIESGAGGWNRAWSADYDLDYNLLPDEIPQMPMGCTAIRTIRGVTLFGGRMGNQGEVLQLQRGTASSVLDLPEPIPRDDRNGRGVDEIAVRHLDSAATQLDGGWGLGSGCIPPAYSGQKITCVDVAGERLFEDDLETTRIDEIINSYANWDGFSAWDAPWFSAIRYRVTSRALRSNRVKVAKATQLLLPRGSIQWGEPGAPNAVPATNTAWLDAEKDEDVVAIGRLGESAIICTQRQTHAFSWRRGPGGAAPVLLSSEFGCIATNSMVEFDGGTAWLSERGPVASFGGPPVWVGEEVARDFVGSGARYLRDDLGHMAHSWAAHDRQRKLVYFGLRVSDVGDTVESYPSGDLLEFGVAGANLQTKFPCDEVLVWSYTTNSWSRWVPHLSILWMAELKFDDGVHRMCFLATDSRIYALDDAYGAGWDMHTTAPADTAGVASTTFTTANPTFQSGIPQDGWARPGMTFYIFSPTTGPTGAAPNGGIRGTGTIVSVDSTIQVTLSTACTWAAGDVIVIGAPVMEVDFRFAVADLKESHAISAVNIEHSVHTFKTATGDWPAGWSGTEPRAWVSTSVETEDGVVAMEDPLRDKAGAVLFLGDRALHGGGDEGREFTTSARAPRGRVRGFGSRLKLAFRGAAQVRLSDIGVEVAQA